jgi:hypothetical protein
VNRPAWPPVPGTPCRPCRAVRTAARPGTQPGLAGGPGHEHALDVGAGVVQPWLARLVEQRNACQRGHPLVRRREPLRVRRSLLQLADQGCDRRQREVGGRAVAGTGREQVELGDRLDRRDHVVKVLGPCAVAWLGGPGVLGRRALAWLGGPAGARAPEHPPGTVSRECSGPRAPARHGGDSGACPPSRPAQAAARCRRRRCRSGGMVVSRPSGPRVSRQPPSCTAR